MDRNPNIAAFDSEAQVLDRLFPAGRPSHSAHPRELLVRMGLAPDEGGTIVELGCGMGNLMEVILDLFPRARVLGIDGGPRLIEIARQRLGDNPRVRLLVAAFEDLDWDALPQQSAAVVSVHSLEHVAPEHRRLVFRGIHRLLRPGGVFLSQEWAADTTPPGVDTRDRALPEHLPARMREAIAAGRITEEEHWRLWDKLAQPDTHFFMGLEAQLAALREAGFGQVTGEWLNEALTVVGARA